MSGHSLLKFEADVAVKVSDTILDLFGKRLNKREIIWN